MSDQRIVPYLMYRDAAAAIEFLTRAFGFEESFRYAMDDGVIGHAEVTYQDNRVMLATASEAFGRSPLDLPNVHGQVYCLVDDVDAHFERARLSGAAVVAAPANTEYGSRMYRAVDPEGHRWIFAQPTEDA